MATHSISDDTYIITPDEYNRKCTIVRPKTLRFAQEDIVDAQYLPDIRAALEQRQGIPVKTLYIQHAAPIIHLRDVYLLHHRDAPNRVELQSFHDASEHIFHIREIPVTPLTELIATTPLTHIRHRMEENMYHAYKHLQQDKRSIYYPHHIQRRNKLQAYHGTFLSVTVSGNIHDPDLLQISLIFHHRYAKTCQYQYFLPYKDTGHYANLHHHLSAFYETIIHQPSIADPTQSAHAHMQYIRAISHHTKSESYIHDILHCITMFFQHYHVPIQS